MLWDTCYTGAEAAFWRCFVKSLQTAGVDTASLTWQELPRNAATRQRVIEVLQASKLKKTVVFVWNNYHLLGSEDCDKLLLALAKADLPNWHFVLLTQRPPDFTLDELVLKGECLYLQPKDFAFEVSDIIVYYRKNGIVLERRAAENLLAATEAGSAPYICICGSTTTGRARKQAKNCCGWYRPWLIILQRSGKNTFNRAVYFK